MIKLAEIILTLFLSALVSGYEKNVPIPVISDDEDPKCSNLPPVSSDFFGLRCCGLEDFSYKHLEHFIPDCSIPPKNQSMSLSDSYWKFVQCLASKGLKSKTFSLPNFTELMSAGLCDFRKAQILSMIKAQIDLDRKEGKKSEILIEARKSEIDNLNSFKFMWTTYFSVEREICLDNKKNATDYKERWEVWRPVNNCGEQNYPKVNRFRKFDLAMETCLKSLINRKKSKNKSQRVCLEVSCQNIEFGLIGKDLTSRPNYEIIPDELLAKFYSKFVREQIVQILWQSLDDEVNATASDSLNGIIKKVKRHVTSSLEFGEDANDHKNGLKDICKNSTIFLYTFQKLVRGVQKAEPSLCLT